MHRMGLGYLVALVAFIAATMLAKVPIGLRPLQPVTVTPQGVCPRSATSQSRHLPRFVLVTAKRPQGLTNPFAFTVDSLVVPRNADR